MTRTSTRIGSLIYICVCDGRKKTRAILSRTTSRASPGQKSAGCWTNSKRGGIATQQAIFNSILQRFAKADVDVVRCLLDEPALCELPIEAADAEPVERLKRYVPSREPMWLWMLTL